MTDLFASKSTQKLIRCFSVFSLFIAASSPAWANFAPMITQYAEVNTSTIMADGQTQYTVSMTASDADGYDELRDMRVLFNFTQSNMDTSQGRGYIVWGKTDGDITRFGGNYYLADAVGGGRWGYIQDNWGGTTYITPVSASVSTSGNASGGTGTRTVTWTFQAKSAWAFNPLVNDPDCWVADYNVNVGWVDSPHDFDVVGASCPQTSTTPSAPVVTNVASTTADIAIAPGDSSSDYYAIEVSPAPILGKRYIQADGSIDEKVTWLTKTGWETTTVTGLRWDTTYTFHARAYTNDGSTCPSNWGPAAQVTTEPVTFHVDSENSVSFSPGVRGTNPYRSIPANDYDELWQLTAGSSGRGLAGGLDADTYDWRDIYSGSNWGLRGGYFTTLQFLRGARNNSTTSNLLTTNIFGGGYKNSTDGTFICQYDNAEGLAADWVRYTNIILQNYRQGDESTLTGEDLRVYDSIIDWGGKDKLLAPEENQTPKIQYWEIGNEPELGGFPGFLTDHHMDPTAYHDRYASMAQAMLAVDPTINIGPCLMDPGDADGSGQWLDALAADASIPLDFIGFHPYYSAIKINWGNPDGMTDGLRNYKSFLQDRIVGMHDIMAQNGRTDYELMATEWNPLNWDAPGDAQYSMSMALGIVEGVFTFAEEDVLAAHFWERPQSKTGPTGAFTGLRDHMGDILVHSVEDFGVDTNTQNFRLYVTKDSANPNKIAIWGLNFNEDEKVSFEISLVDPVKINSATLMHYGMAGDDASGGDTSLTDYSGMTWESQDVTSSVDPLNINMELEDAEITLLVLNTSPTIKPDFDRDGDVDQADFGQFQLCLSGANIPQPDPACKNAKLDTDDDVDSADTNRFLQCFSGANVSLDPDCLP